MSLPEVFLRQKHRLKKNKSNYRNDDMKYFPEQIMPDRVSGFFCVVGFFCFSQGRKKNASCLKDSGAAAKRDSGENRQLRTGKFAAGADLMNAGGNLCNSREQCFCFDRKKGNFSNPRSKNGKQHNIAADYNQCVTGGHQNFI